GLKSTKTETASSTQSRDHPKTGDVSDSLDVRDSVLATVNSAAPRSEEGRLDVLKFLSGERLVSELKRVTRQGTLSLLMGIAIALEVARMDKPTDGSGLEKILISFSASDRNANAVKPDASSDAKVLIEAAKRLLELAGKSSKETKD